MEWNPGRVIGVGQAHGAGLDLEHVIFAVAVGVYPFADGIARECRLDLRRPIYKKTASYGHFGRNEPEFTWEKTDKAAKLKSQAGL